jgi:CBS domain containing-hemolysin-like protein
MATSPDNGSRLWRGMRHLFFGGESDHSLRDQIEEVIDEAEEHRGGESSDLSPLERQMLRNLLHFGDRTAGDICVTRGEFLHAAARRDLRRSRP